MTKVRALTLILMVCLASLSSCKKETKRIGNDLQPTSSLINVSFTDEQDVIASTFRVPYLSTKMLSSVMLGNMNDPEFGISNFDFYTQFSLSTSSQTWGDNAVTDSVVLNLCYSGFYADTTQLLNVKIYEINEEMYADSAYRSNMTLECETEELANFSFIPHPLTPPDTTLDRGVLRIPINVSLGEKFIANEVHMETNDDFKEFFKGLHVECDMNSTAGAICFFNPTHSYSYLRVYYHNDTDTLTYDFTVTSSDVRFNHFSHDYSASQITFNDSVNNEKLYVQGAAGTRVWVKFPNLAEWASSQADNVVVNEAKLVLTGVETDTAMYTPPIKLVVTAAKFDTDTTYLIIPDQLVSSEYYGGSYNAEDGTVWFRVTEYIQNVIKNGTYATDANGLLIYVDQGSSVPRRWVFGGPQGENPVRLDMVYSKINN